MDLPKQPHEPPRWMKVPVEILVALCLLVGMMPALTVEPILAVAASSVLQGPVPEHDLAIWHGFNTAVFMSIAALAGGVCVYLMRKPLFAIQEKLEKVLDFRALYEFLLEKLFAFCNAVTYMLDKQSLQRMLFVFMLFVLALGVSGITATENTFTLTGEHATLPIDGVSLFITLIIVISAFTTVVMHRQRLISLVMLGTVGLGVSLVFVKFSAPDLALTQLSVEVVTIVLMLLALYFLPQQSPAESGNWLRSRDAVIAAAGGARRSAAGVGGSDPALRYHRRLFSGEQPARRRRH